MIVTREIVRRSRPGPGYYLITVGAGACFASYDGESWRYVDSTGWSCPIHPTTEFTVVRPLVFNQSSGFL